MKIHVKRVINPQRYLYALHPGDKFYIAVPLEKTDYSFLQFYGIHHDSPARIPVPCGPATTMNANGKWRILKDLPKEKRSIEHDYHIVDWHGNDHYGTCWQNRWCYQRLLIPPTELAFVIDDDVLYSPLLENSESNFANIKSAMNVALEMLGRCEIWTAERAPAIPPVKQTEVPWEILRPGTVNGKPHTFFSGPRFFEIIVAVEKLSQLFTLFKLRRFQMNDIQTVTQNVRLQQWTAIIQDRQASGLKVDDYCSEHNISRNAYYYWLRKVKAAAIENSGNLFAEVNPSFQKMMPEHLESGCSPVSICLGDAVIHVNEDASSCLLHMVIEAVRNAE